MNTLILIVLAVINLGLGYKLRFDDNFRENYVKNSPKAWLWRKIFGDDRACSVIKNLALIPIVFGALLLVFVTYTSLLN